jgi:hypothetical protein
VNTRPVPMNQPARFSNGKTAYLPYHASGSDRSSVVISATEVRGIGTERAGFRETEIPPHEL